MSSRLSSKSSPILIVGAGVFGLSTAIHLAERGYTNIKILDKQNYHESEYSYDKGCDAASADINKIIRAAYGSEIWYQKLALGAIAKWKEWNDEIESGRTMPQGFTTSDKLFVNNGNLMMSSDPSLSRFEEDTLQSMTKVGLSHTQVDTSRPEQVKRAIDDGFEFALKAFDLKNVSALLDTQSGFAHAGRACRFALHKAESLGVKTEFGETRGQFSSFLKGPDSKILGVKAVDGRSHLADLTIMASGGWTPALVTQLDGLCETTAGSVALFRLPPDQVLRDRFAPENFPTWAYNLKHGKHGGLYGFARDSDGIVKIGYRGTKYTNPQTQPDGATRSIPKTRWTQESIRQIPLTASRVIKGFVKDFLPELMQCEMSTRLCWYTDTYDNHFVIDFVPGTSGLMVATGGSGHGFKFLPILGKHVVDRIENKSNQYLHLWNWRSLDIGEKSANVLMEGVEGERTLSNQRLASESGFKGQSSRL